MKEADTSEDVEDIWKGIILSLTENNARKFKTKEDQTSSGKTIGIALQTRGWVLQNMGESALIRDHRFFGNNPKKDQKDKNKVEILFFDLCTKTWTYGAEMYDAIRSMFVLQAQHHIASLDWDNLVQ